MSEIVISRFDPTHLAEWIEFLRSSNDGTLFHDPRFLDYHPAGRFEFEHLLARRGKSLIAVIPGALVRESDGISFTSTAGASVGAPVTRPKMALSEATD